MILMELLGIYLFFCRVLYRFPLQDKIDYITPKKAWVLIKCKEKHFSTADALIGKPKAHADATQKIPR